MKIAVLGQDLRAGAERTLHYVASRGPGPARLPAALQAPS